MIKLPEVYKSIYLIFLMTWNIDRKRKISRWHEQ